MRLGHPSKPCTYPGCRTLSRDGTARCPAHPREPWATTRDKGTSTQRGYGAPWRKLREQILKRDDYCCVPCAKAGRWTVASEVDHIIEKEDGGTDDPENLQSICGACHKAKTKESQRKRRLR